MHRLTFVILTLFASEVSAQNYSGHVADAQDGTPISGVIVTGTNSAGTPMGYTTTSAAGDFTLVLREGTASRLKFSMMGYRRQSVPASEERMLVLMSPEATAIREVTIRAPRLKFGEDTVSYNVASFTEAQDRTIADVLRKMPGIEVAPSGEIKYNGESINKFYIEGLDMLDGRYSLATDNIAPQDVADVEVLENHQPVKALKDIAFSEKAAINLRLKEHARSHWTGSLQGAAGCSPFLWNAGLFAMRIGSGSQSMFHLKTDASGHDPTAETRHLTVEDLLDAAANRLEPQDYLQVGTHTAPLDDTRTRRNRSYMASANQLRKLSDDYQLSSAVTYGYDHTVSDYAARTSWYLPDGNRVDTELETAQKRQQQLTAQVMLRANTERFYLQEKLSAQAGWDDLRAALEGSYPNSQRASRPVYGANNDLKYVRRMGNRSLTVTSYMGYLSQPQSLKVSRTTGSQLQKISARSLFMNHNAAFGTRAGRFDFQFKGSVTALVRRFDSNLTGLETDAGTTNRLELGYTGVSLQPSATYQSRRLRLTLDLTAGYRHYRLDDRRLGTASPAGIFAWSPRLHAKWSPSARLTFKVSGAFGRENPDDEQMGGGIILRNYRELSVGTTAYAQSLRRSVRAGMDYKSPIGGLFAHFMVGRTWNDLPYLATRSFEGDYIVNGYLRRTNRTAGWFAAGGVSQNIDPLHGQAGLEISYSSNDLQTLQQGVLTPYESSTLGIAPRFNFRFAPWCNAEYQLNYRYIRLRIAREAASARHDFNQRLSLNFIAAKKLVMELTGEHYYSQLSGTQSKHLLLADIRLRWKIGEKWELSASAANLFGQDEYAYTLFDGLSSVTCRYAIRPRDLLLGASWKF